MYRLPAQIFGLTKPLPALIGNTCLKNALKSLLWLLSVKQVLLLAKEELVEIGNAA